MATPRVKTELPRIIGSGLLVDDASLATGLLTLKDGGNDLLEIKVSDIVSWSYDAYAAGTAEIAQIDLNPASLVADNAYSISIKLPNVVNFFGGGGHATADARESDAVYVTRTYTVYTDATPSAAELAELFRDRINADLYAAFDATAAAGVIELTACDATAGAFIIDVSNITGATTATPTANVLPVGLPLEVERYVDPSTVTAASYDRHIIKFRKFVNHNAVKGLEVVKEQALIVYSDTTDTLNATLEPILDGTHVPASDYLGAPEV